MRLFRSYFGIELCHVNFLQVDRQLLRYRSFLVVNISVRFPYNPYSAIVFSRVGDRLLIATRQGIETRNLQDPLSRSTDYRIDYR